MQSSSNESSGRRASRAFARTAWCHAALACAVAVTIGCSEVPQAGEAVPDPPTGVRGTNTGVADVNLAELPAGMAESAIEDARRRVSGVLAEEFRIVAAEAVTWADGSLGCPEPGMMYTQALVPGYRIIVQAGSETMEYHAGRAGAPKFCPPGQAEPPSAGVIDR